MSKSTSQDDLEVGAEEFLQYLGLALGTVCLSAILFYFIKKFASPEQSEDIPEPVQGRGGNRAGNRRQVAARNRRGRRAG